MEYYSIPLYVFFGILPSSIWLFYYLKKDLHPEPKRMIVEIFLTGALITLPAFFIQIGLSELLKQLQMFPLFTEYPIITNIIKWFFVIALTEELLKYLVVRISILNSYVVDEPLDIMLYMVVAALGFAAVENILYLLPISNVSYSSAIGTTIMVSFIRFIGATFLHTLCSALVGYFLALSSLNSKKELLLTMLGLTIAVAFHGLYDFSITAFGQPLNVIIPVAIILILTVFMLYDFDGIKKIKSICKI